MSAIKSQASFSNDTATSDNESPNKIKIPGKILIEGNIGSGKTTLLTTIEAPLYLKKFERVEKYTLLKHYYENPKQYAFALQKQIAEIHLEVEDTIDKPAVFERSLESGIYIFSDMLNKDGTLNDREFEELKRYLSFTIPIAAFIYIDVDVDTCHDRIKLRGRECEQGISKDYLSKLKVQIDAMYEQYKSSGIPCLRIENRTGELELNAQSIDDFISDIIIR